MGEALCIRSIETMSGEQEVGPGDIDIEEDDNWIWPSPSRAARAARAAQGAQAPKRVSFQALPEKGPYSASAEQTTAWDRSRYMSGDQEMEKGSSDGKGTAASGTNGGQPRKLPKVKGEDHHGIGKDLAKFEQKVDSLLETMGQFTQEAGMALLPPPEEDEEEQEGEEEPLQKPLRHYLPPAPPLPTLLQAQQQAQQQQVLPGQYGGKGHKRSRESDQAECGGSGGGGAFGKYA